MFPSLSPDGKWVLYTRDEQGTGQTDIMLRAIGALTALNLTADSTADDLQAAWNAPAVTTRARQRLLRTLIVNIIADVDEAAREVILTIHWQGGQHSQLRLTKPKSGEHGCRTPEEAMAVIRSMTARWPNFSNSSVASRFGPAQGSSSRNARR